MPTTCLPTVGLIARQLSEPLHRVEYVIRTRDIQPIGRAGNCRVFRAEDIELIAEELRRIDLQRDLEDTPC